MGITGTHIDTHEALRDLIGETKPRTRQKILDHLDEHARNLIAHSPFVLLATSAPDGSCDVSPRGDPAGSVLVPGMNETLRVNGRAKLLSDAPFFDSLVVQGKRPKLAVVIEVEELYMYCAKAFLRSSLWDPSTWPERSTLPTLGTILRDQLSLSTSAKELDDDLNERALTQQY